jgi:hypothetical protein
VIAILHYAFLKNMRDGSLAAFVLGPFIMLTASLLGVAVFTKGLLAYPLSLDANWSPARSAAEIAPVTVFIAALFAALAGFWGFRGEIVSRSLGSFVLAVRPVKIQLASTLFGAAAGFGGYILTSVSLFTLMAALPPHPVRLAVDAAIMCLCGSAAGSLAVILSSEPWAILPLYLFGIVVMPWLIKMRGAVPELIGLALSMICVVVSAFFLERRCAT